MARAGSALCRARLLVWFAGPVEGKKFAVIGMLARSDLRRRWRSWVVLGLLAGATVGFAAAGAAGARRSDTAVARFERAAAFPEAAILANTPAFDAHRRAEVAALAEVARTQPFLIAVVATVTRPAALQSSTLLPTQPQSVQAFVGTLVAGRMPSPRAADEVVVDQNARRRFGLGLGSTIEVAQQIAPGDVAHIPPAMVPSGHTDLSFRTTLRVVGIAKSVSSDPSWVPSSGFYAKYSDRLVGFTNEFVSLRGGPHELPRLRTDVSRIMGQPVNVEDTLDLFGLRKAKSVTSVETQGLLLFALAVIGVGGVLVGQALVRAVTAGAGDVPTWRALGAGRMVVVLGLALPVVVSAAIGIASSVAVAVALSPRFPIGLARTYDLDVGVHADWLVLIAATGVLVIAVVVAALLGAIFPATRPIAPRPGRSRRADWTARLALPPALAIGSRLATEPGRGNRAVPIRSALVGAIIGVFGVVACSTFGAGLDDAVTTWARSGVVWDYAIASGEGPVAPADFATIAHDPAVASVLDANWTRALPINGTPTPTFGTATIAGDLRFVVISGRAPTKVDEIAFAPTTLHALHLHVGENARVGAAKTPVRVVGEALLLATSHTDYDQSGWMTIAGLRAALPPAVRDKPDEFEEYALIRFRPGADVPAAQHRLAALGGGSTYDQEPATRPTAVVDLGRLRSLPLALGIFFALLAIATVAHALVTTVRRRQRDLAVLRTLGFTRRESRLAIAWQATLLAVAGLAIGTPLGVIGGRAFWHSLASNFPLAYAPPFALLAVVLVIPSAMLVANAVAAGPAHAATRISPATALRTE
jgi:hypothetical protein